MLQIYYYMSNRNPVADVDVDDEGDKTISFR